MKDNQDISNKRIVITGQFESENAVLREELEKETERVKQILKQRYGKYFEGGKLVPVVDCSAYNDEFEGKAVLVHHGHVRTSGFSAGATHTLYIKIQEGDLIGAVDQNFMAWMFLNRIDGIDVDDIELKRTVILREIIETEDDDDPYEDECIPLETREYAVRAEICVKGFTTQLDAGIMVQMMYSIYENGVIDAYTRIRPVHPCPNYPEANTLVTVTSKSKNTSGDYYTLNQLLELINFEREHVIHFDKPKSQYSSGSACDHDTYIIYIKRPLALP